MTAETSPKMTRLATKLKSLMALASIHSIDLGDDEGDFYVYRYIDRMQKEIVSPFEEIRNLTVDLAYLVKEKLELENSEEYCDGYGSMTLDGGELIVTIRVSQGDYDTEEFEGTLSTEVPAESRIITELPKLGITRVNLGYSGTGDSGGMDSFEFLAHETVIPDSSITDELISVLEDFVYEKADANFNDSGSSGKAVLHFIDGILHYSITHHNHITQYDSIEETF